MVLRIDFHLLGILLIISGDMVTTCSAQNLTIVGGGSTFARIIYREWMMLYKIARSQFLPNLAMTYDAQGSGFGIGLMKGTNASAAGPAIYGASDSAISEKDYTAYPDLQMFPTCAGAVVIVFNLPDIKELRLKGEIIADIFRGDINHWNHPAIGFLNPNLSLPNSTIRRIARRDSSGTTSVFTGALSEFSPEWRSGPGTFSDPAVNDVANTSRFPAPVEFWSATTIGVAGLLAALPYTLAYLSLSDARQADLSIASLYNAAGNLVTPEMINAGVVKTMEFNVSSLGSRFTGSLLNYANPEAYPIAAYTYMVVNMSTAPNSSCEQVTEFARYVEWFLTDRQAHAAALDNQMVPLSSKVGAKVIAEVLQKISCAGGNVWEMLQSVKQAEADSVNVWLQIAKFAGPLIAALILLFILYVAYSRHKMNAKITAKEWLIAPTEISMTNSELGSAVSMGSKSSSRFQDSLFSKSSEEVDYTRAYWSGHDVLLFEVDDIKWNPNKLDFKTCKILHDLRHTKSENILKFYGLSLEVVDKTSSRTTAIYDLSVKQNLHHLLMHSPYDMSDEVKYALAIDVAHGLRYLHSKNIVHGRLNSTCCFVDAKWTIKIGDWISWRLKELEHMSISTSLFLKDIQNPSEAWPIVFNDPVILQHEASKQVILKPWKGYDIYSFGIMLIEIFSRKIPYSMEAEKSSWAKIIQEIRDERVPPLFDSTVPSDIKSYVLAYLLSDDRRPGNISEVIAKLGTMSRCKNQSLVETMLEAMDRFMENLQSLVDERTAEVQARTAEVEAMTRHMESLLENMLPKQVVRKLRNNERVEPEFFDNVTVYFSDICRFTDLCGESTPLEVVNMLNSLFTMCDSIIGKFDVYKVETIGDAYMCVSGLPTRNGSRHGAEITFMALALLDGMAGYVVPHRPDVKLCIRIGLNSGPVMSGVVGLKMPRYCLFGDTVNTAARMESTGKSGMIHCTQETVDFVKDTPGIKVVERGHICIKGKGEMHTFFLERAKPDEVDTTVAQPH